MTGETPARGPLTDTRTTAEPRSDGASDPPPASAGDAASTSALVVEVSQLRYALRARTVRSAAATDGEFRAVLRRRDALLRELRRRGLDFPEERLGPGTARPEQAPAGPGGHDVGPAPQEDAPAISGPPATPVTSVDLAAKVEQLEQGMVSRTVIGQAQGILIERLKVTADEAFALLVRSSSVTNRNLVAIAAELVLTGTLPGAR